MIQGTSWMIKFIYLIRKFVKNLYVIGERKRESN